MDIAVLKREPLPRGYQIRDREIMAQLGGGGFGITYRAKHTLLNNYLAIKEFFPIGCVRGERGEIMPAPEPETNEHVSLSDDDLQRSRENFVREGQLLVKLTMEKCPGIVRVFDLFEANNTAYLEMEIAEGRALNKIVTDRDSALSVAAVMKIVRKLAEPLEFLHANQIIHRDVKPDNILWHEVKGTATLIDFGGARELLRSHHLLRDGLNSRGYTPPEQYEKRAPGPQADVYSLAATIFYLLLGDAPTDAQIRLADDRLPTITDERREIPRSFSAVVRQGLDLDIAQRPKTVREFLEKLERSLHIGAEANMRREWALTSSEATTEALRQERLKRERNERVRNVLVAVVLVGIIAMAARIAWLFAHHDQVVIGPWTFRQGELHQVELREIPPKQPVR